MIKPQRRLPRSIARASNAYETAVATGTTTETIQSPALRSYERHLLYHSGRTSFSVPRFLHAPSASQHINGHTGAADGAEKQDSIHHAGAPGALWHSGLLWLEGSVNGRVLLRSLRQDEKLEEHLKQQFAEAEPQLLHTAQDAGNWIGSEISATMQTDCDSTASLSSTESCDSTGSTGGDNATLK